MISQETLNILKIEHAPKKIIHVIFKDNEYIFRSLTKKEMTETMSIPKDKYGANELICQTALLYPNSVEIDFTRFGLAGFPDYVAKIILEESCYNDVNKIKELLEFHRCTLKTIDKQAFVFIKLSFPEITKEDYDNMDWQTVCEYVALSEEIINTRENISIGKALDPEKVFKLDIGVNEIDNTEEEIELTPKEEHREHINYISSLYERGIDPITLYNISDVIKAENIVSPPFLGGRHWDNEGVMNEIRKTISKTTK